MSLMDTLKEIVGVVQKIDNIDLIKDVNQALLQANELIIENLELKEEIRELKKAKDLDDKLVYCENSYWIENEGPYCSNCWDVSKKLIRIHSRNGYSGKCPNCENSVTFNAEKQAESQNKMFQSINSPRRNIRLDNY